jgi:hypothetical protein
MRNNKLFYGLALIFLAIVILFIGQGISSQFFKKSKSNTHASSHESLSLTGVTSINSDCTGDIEIITSADERVEFFYDDDNYENKTKIEGNELLIDFSSINTFFFNWNSSGDVKVKVYTKGLKSIKQSGVGDIESSNTLVSDELTLINDGVGSMDMDVNVNKLIIKNEGVGSIEISGKASHSTLLNDGTGSIDANKLTTNYANVSNDGVGDITVNASDSIDLSNTGVGDIAYKGSAKINSSISEGTGSIHKN